MTATTPDAQAFAFEDATEPKREKVSAPNPFTDVVGSLPVDDPNRKGKSFTAPAGVKLSVIRSKLDSASKVHGVTVRWALTDPETGERVEVTPELVGPVNVFIRATSQVRKGAKAEDTDAAAAAAIATPKS